MNNVSDDLVKLDDKTSVKIEEQPVSKPFSYSAWFKKSFLILSGLISFLSAFGLLGGVLFQRGVFGAIRLQNIEINTTIYDLIYYGYYSSMLIFLHAYKKLNFDSIIEGMFFPSIVTSFLFVFFLYLVKNKDDFPHMIEKTKFFKWKGWKFLKLLLYPLVWIIGFLLPSTFKAGLAVLVLFPFALIGMIGIAGEKSGHRYMKGLMEESPKCVEYNTSDLKALSKMLEEYGEIITGCGTYVIGERVFSGEIIQNNKEGYLILQKSSVVYASKDGRHCFFNYFVTQKAIKERIEKKEDLTQGIFQLDENLEKSCKRPIS